MAMQLSPATLLPPTTRNDALLRISSLLPYYSLRLVRNIVDFLKSEVYLFTSLFSKFTPHIQMHPPFSSESAIFGFEALGLDTVNKKKRKMSEKAKEYLKSDYQMYGLMVSPWKLSSSLKGELQITRLYRPLLPDSPCVSPLSPSKPISVVIVYKMEMTLYFPGSSIYNGYRTQQGKHVSRKFTMKRRRSFRKFQLSFLLC